VHPLLDQKAKGNERPHLYRPQSTTQTIMSSSLEIVIVHLPDNVAPDHEQSKDFIKDMRYVKSQKGNKSVRWGRAVGQNVSVIFVGRRSCFAVCMAAGFADTHAVASITQSGRVSVTTTTGKKNLATRNSGTSG
jgi:hypothetical protein